MSAISVPSVNAYTAHHEWANRPADERYTSVANLFAAARARRAQTVEYVTESHDLRVEAVGPDSLQLVDATRQPIAMTHWSFGQLASIGGAPAQYLCTLPAPIAADALNYGLARERRPSHQIYIDRATPRTALALTSPKYVRVHHDQLASRVLDLMASHSEWHLPLAYKDGQWGADRVPSGAYLGDRDMFLFLVDGNRSRGSRRSQWRPVPRIHSPEQRCRRGGVVAGSVPLPVRVWQPRAPCHRRMSDPTKLGKVREKWTFGPASLLGGESQ